MLNLLTREASFERGGEDSNGDYTVNLAMASEMPYERWFGIEVLQVSDKSVRLDRLNDSAAVLFNHDWDRLLGVHVKGTTKAGSDKVLRGQVRLQGSTQEGRDAIALVKSGILTKSSVGYRVHSLVEKTKTKSGEPLERTISGATFERICGDLQARGMQSHEHFTRELDAVAGHIDRAADELPTYIVIDWEPHENSLVTVPADPTVGVGRSARALEPPQPLPAPSATRSQRMDDTANSASANADANVTLVRGEAPKSPSGVELNAMRSRAIENICKANQIDDGIRNLWISSGASLESVSDELLRIMEDRGKSRPTSVAKLDLTANETNQFSITRAIAACADGNWSKAGFEAECSREIASRLQKVPDPKKFYIPYDVQHRTIDGRAINSQQRALAGVGNAPRLQTRDVTVGTTTAGGFLVQSVNQSFIELLRNRSVAFRMGARPLSGLVGNVNIPKQSAAATAYWLSTEATAITESQQTFGQLAFAPKTVGGYTEISRLLLLQSSPDIEGIVNSDLAAIIGLAVDTGVLSGSGAAGQPTGISNTAGIGTATGQTSIAYAGMLSYQTQVANANVMPANGGYVTTPTVAALLMQRVKFASTATPLWDGNMWDANACGFPGMASNQIAAGTMYFGDWSQVIVAEWGVLEVEVNPYANFQAGIIGVRAMMTVDVGLRYPAAFSLGSTIT